MADFSTNIPQIAVNQAAKETAINGLIDAASVSTYFGRNYNASSALTWGYLGGIILVDGTPTRIANGTLSLINSATNYIEIDRSGTISFNTSGFTAGRTPLYQVTASGGVVTTWLDLRYPLIPTGRLSLSVAGNTDVTLTAIQARNDILEFIGALTGNINVIVPANAKEWFAYNNTSGAFTLTVKTVAGTGVAITQGLRDIIYADGTNVVPAASQSSFTGFANPSATLGLTAVNGSATTAMRSDAAQALSQSIVPTWTGVHTHAPTLAANTSGDGVILTNSAAATSGNQRYSNRARFTGNGFGGSTSQAVDWVCENRPVQGVTNPSTNLAIASQINGGGYIDRLVVTSGAVMSLNNNTAIDPTAQSLGFSPSVSLVGNDTTDTPAIEFHSWNGGSNFISPVMAGGTATSPSGSPAASNILVFGARGHNGAAYTGTKAAINFATVNSWTGSDNSTKITVRITPSASTTLTTAAIIDGTGFVIGTSDPGGTDQLRVNGALTINSATLIQTKTAFTNGAGTSIGTLTNAPAATNPTKWIPINDNGTTRYIPAW